MKPATTKIDTSDKKTNRPVLSTSSLFCQLLQVTFKKTFYMCTPVWDHWDVNDNLFSFQRKSKLTALEVLTLLKNIKVIHVPHYS